MEPYHHDPRSILVDKTLSSLVRESPIEVNTMVASEAVRTFYALVDNTREGFEPS